MPLDMAYLVKHGRLWRVQVIVPGRLRPIIGKSKLIALLRTDSPALASREKHRHVHEFKQMIAAAEVEAKRRAKQPPDPLVAEALTWRQSIEDARARDDARGQDTDETEDAEDYEPWNQTSDAESAEMGLDARYHEIVRADGRAKAEAFIAIATAKGTPIAALADDWLAEKPMKQRQKLDYRRAVTKFEAWALARNLSGTAEAVTKRHAGDYKTSAFVRAGVNWRTANKDISALSGYWKWLETRGIAPENVWRGMMLPKLKPQDGAAKRAYSDEELLRLLNGNAPSAALRDAMLIAALSGMRVEEICCVRVGDIKGDLIDLKGTKTAAARRVVPVHVDLATVLARRCEGKGSGVYLFNELRTPPPDGARERSQPVVKAFTRYRRATGVDERAEGARQSNVDFHSFRRWFIKTARDALTSGRASGYSYWTIAEIVGHSKEDSLPLAMTMSRYAGDDTAEAKRACVASVKLPTPLTLSQP